MEHARGRLPPRRFRADLRRPNEADHRPGPADCCSPRTRTVRATLAYQDRDLEEELDLIDVDAAADGPHPAVDCPTNRLAARLASIANEGPVTVELLMLEGRAAHPAPRAVHRRKDELGFRICQSAAGFQTVHKQLRRNLRALAAAMIGLA